MLHSVPCSGAAGLGRACLRLDIGDLSSGRGIRRAAGGNPGRAQPSQLPAGHRHRVKRVAA